MASSFLLFLLGTPLSSSPSSTTSSSPGISVEKRPSRPSHPAVNMWEPASLTATEETGEVWRWREAALWRKRGDGDRDGEDVCGSFRSGTNVRRAVPSCEPDTTALKGEEEAFEAGESQETDVTGPECPAIEHTMSWE